MNSENLSFLQDSLKYLGFGENSLLNEQLEQEISKEPKEFKLYTEAFYDEDLKLEAALYFRRSDQQDMYFFNKYDALLRRIGEEDKDRRQTFYISKGTGVTFKEAFNLLQGRAVNKDLTNIEGEKYNAWIQLNFEEQDLHHNYKVKQYRAQYGYDLEKTLAKYPIRELQNEEIKSMLIRSLRRGNLHLVSFTKANKTEKMFIESNPQFKTINIYPIATRVAHKPGRKQAGSVEEKPDTVSGSQDPEEWKEEENAAVAEVKEEENGPASLKAPLRKGRQIK